MASAQDFRELTEDELSKKEIDIKEELFNLRIQVSTQQTTNYARLKELRRDVARINTIKREKHLQTRSDD